MNKFITRFLKHGVLISTTGLIGIVSLQIYARFFLDQAPPWTEEASRLCFIYATAFAAGLAVKSTYYVHLDYFFNLFSEKVRQKLRVLIPFLTLILFLIMSYYSVQFIYLGRVETSPSLKIKMAYIFVSILVMSLSVSYFSYRKLLKEMGNYRSFQNKTQRRGSSGESGTPNESEPSNQSKPENQ